MTLLWGRAYLVPTIGCITELMGQWEGQFSMQIKIIAFRIHACVK